MIKNDCLFCKLANGQLPTAKIFEDETFVAILDLYPNTRGQTVIISKQHHTSDIFKTNFDIVHKGIDTAKKVAEKLNKTLKPDRICMITEGTYIDHLHIKLFPIYNVNKTTGEDTFKNAQFYNDFPGFLTTYPGPMLSDKDLMELRDAVVAGA